MNKKGISRCSAKLNIAIEKIGQEIDLNGQSLGGASSLEQLKRIQSDLLGMLKSLDDDSVSWDYIGFGRLIVDSWPMNSDLGATLLEAEQEYKKLLRG
ncbi:hypothetical protein [Microbulbifer sp.]|uniref:hypothetical protein n=1 Tax=Microbulbifer sp. TaxID=1908541 RepID=UPI003F2B6449